MAFKITYFNVKFDHYIVTWHWYYSWWSRDRDQPLNIHTIQDMWLNRVPMWIYHAHITFPNIIACMWLCNINKHSLIINIVTGRLPLLLHNYASALLWCSPVTLIAAVVVVWVALVWPLAVNDLILSMACVAAGGQWPDSQWRLCGRWRSMTWFSVALVWPLAVNDLILSLGELEEALDALEVVVTVLLVRKEVVDRPEQTGINVNDTLINQLKNYCTIYCMC